MNNQSIAETLQEIWAQLPEGVRLVAVSKFHPAEMIQQAYDAGQRTFGESRVQELCAKAAVLPQDVDWHFIGHLQRNKVKDVVGRAHLIHSVDSLRLLQAIDREAEKADCTARCLLELHVAQEETKFGFSPEELLQLLGEGEWQMLRHMRLCGLMCMASNTDDERRISSDFRLARKTMDEAKRQFFADDDAFCELSMGMSHDWHLAVAEGSTLIRIGTQIFGERAY